MSNDDDIDRPDRPGDDDEGPITPAEQAHAESFGRLVDGLLHGEPLPPAMDSDDRALLEVATVVVASSRPVELDGERVKRLVDQALEGAVIGRGAGDRAARTGPMPAAAPAAVFRPGHRDQRDDDLAERSATDLRIRRRRRARAARALPWAVASLAAAAAIVLFMVRMPQRTGEPPVGTAETAGQDPATAPLRLGAMHRSRPADPLFGRITRDEADHARERIDVLFADRMDGYRDLAFRRALPEDAP